MLKSNYLPKSSIYCNFIRVIRFLVTVWLHFLFIMYFATINISVAFPQYYVEAEY